MAGKVVEVGLCKDLDAILEETFTLFLYKNDYTPVDGSVAGNFTNCDFSGYDTDGIVLTGWSAAAIAGGVAVSTADPVESTHDGGGTNNTIYGYYVLDSLGVLRWAHRDPAPFLMNAAGLTYRVTPSRYHDNAA